MKLKKDPIPALSGDVRAPAEHDSAGRRRTRRLSASPAFRNLSAVRSRVCLLVLFSAFFLLPGILPAADTRQLRVNVEFARSARDIIAAISVDIPADRRAYAGEAENSGRPTRVLFSLEGDLPRPVAYPGGVMRRDYYDADAVVSVYEGLTRFFVSLPPERGGARYDLDISLLLCSAESCLPVEQRHAGVVAGAPPPVEDMVWYEQWRGSASAPARSQGGVPDEGEIVFAAGNFAVKLTPRYADASLEIDGLGRALLVGIIAGLLLNIMPCVLPVLVLKVSGFGAIAGGNGGAGLRRLREHNLCFVAGVMTLFTALALILGLADLMWGQLYQSQTVLLVLILIVFLLGLSMLGVFTLPVIDLKFDAKAQNPRLRFYLTGLLATFLATPCSGPLLGGVLGWAFTRSLPVLMVVFWAVGIGMSLPYLLLCVRPDMLRILPRPGAWMVRFERIVGFCLLGTTLYLLSILPAHKYLQVSGALLLVAFAAWLWGQYDAGGSWRRGAAGVACAVLVAISAFVLFQPTSPPPKWRAFTPEYFSEQLGKKNMLLEFTADWCPNCKFLEAAVLTDERLLKWRNDFDLEFIRVDMTNMDDHALRLLEGLGSKSIPLTALFPAGENASSPLVLRDVYSARHIERSLMRTFTRAP